MSTTYRVEGSASGSFYNFSVVRIADEQVVSSFSGSGVSVGLVGMEMVGETTLAIHYTDGIPDSFIELEDAVIL